MRLSRKFIFTLLTFVTSFTFAQSTTPPAPLPAPPQGRNVAISAPWIKNLQSLGDYTFWSTPSSQGHMPFIDTIGKAKNIKLTMFHITDPAVVSALKASAQAGNKFQIIINRTNLTDADTLNIALDLQTVPNIELKASPPAFSILHTKAMWAQLSDNENDIVSFVTTTNLTTFFLTTRDYGLTTNNKGIFNEGSAVFDMDFQNGESDLKKVAQDIAAHPGGPSAPAPPSDTPPLSHPNLLWSPVNSQEKIVDLINYAAKGETIISSVENIRNLEVQNAFLLAAARGVQVKLIVPEHDQNPDAAFNFPAIRDLLKLDKSRNLKVKVMPFDKTGQVSAQFPYMHAKMIAVISKNPKRNLGGIFSENFSANSLLFAREVGIVFKEDEPIRGILKDHSEDWKVSIAPQKSKFWNAPPAPQPPLPPPQPAPKMDLNCQGPVEQI